MRLEQLHVVFMHLPISVVQSARFHSPIKSILITSTLFSSNTCLVLEYYCGDPSGDNELRVQLAAKEELS